MRKQEATLDTFFYKSAAWPEGYKRRRFYDDPDRRICVQPHPGHIAASLDKALYEDYLC